MHDRREPGVTEADWRTDAVYHRQDAADPRDCICGLAWPCPLGTALLARDRTLAECEQIRALHGSVSLERQNLEFQMERNVGWSLPLDPKDVDELLRVLGQVEAALAPASATSAGREASE